MRKILSTGSFLVFGLLGLYYMLAFLDVLSDAPTSEMHLEETLSEVGIAVAQMNPLRISLRTSPIKLCVLLIVIPSISTTTVKPRTFG